jgi:hypothetical protein
MAITSLPYVVPHSYLQDLVKINDRIHKIWDFHSSEGLGYGLLDCDTV